VRRDPDLWLWMHRRWRDQEPGSGMGDQGADGTEDAEAEEIARHDRSDV
jgi:hypothetical protein